MEPILSSLILYYSNAPFIVLLCDAATYMELISFGLKLRCHDSSIIIFLRDVAKMSKISLVILCCSETTIVFFFVQCRKEGANSCSLILYCSASTRIFFFCIAEKRILYMFPYSVCVQVALGLHPDIGEEGKVR